MKVAACGRRWGKSVGIAVDLATFAIAYPGTQQMVLAPSLDQTQIIFDSVREIADHPRLRGDIKLRESPFPEARVGGSIIRMRTVGEASRGKRIRGRAAHRIVIDEAAFIREEIINQTVLPMLADFVGAQVIYLSTPFGRNHFHRRFLRGQDGDPSYNPRYKSWQFTSFENEHLNHAYLRELREEMTDLEYRSEILAEFVEDVAAAFRWADIEACIGGELEMPRRGRHYLMGCDLGKWSSYTCIVVVDATELPARVVHFQRFGRLGWAEQRARIRACWAEYGWPTLVIDSTGVGDPTAEDLSRSGQGSLYPYHFTYESKRRLIENLAQMVAFGRCRFPMVRELVDELRFFTYELSEGGRVRFGPQSPFHDDCVVALALGCWLARSLAGAQGLAEAEQAARRKADVPQTLTIKQKMRRRLEGKGLPEDLRKAAR